MSTNLSVNVHVDEDTNFDAINVTDFVSLQIGSSISVFLFTPEQALELYKAAGEAYIILYSMRAKKEAKNELSLVQ